MFLPSGLLLWLESVVKIMRKMEVYIKAEMRFWVSAAQVCDADINRWYQHKAPHPVPSRSRIFLPKFQNPKEYIDTELGHT